jgi:hypothetical protein
MMIGPCLISFGRHVFAFLKQNVKDAYCTLYTKFEKHMCEVIGSKVVGANLLPGIPTGPTSTVGVTATFGIR